MHEIRAILRQANMALLGGVTDGKFTEAQVAAEFARQASGWQARVPRSVPVQDDCDVAWAEQLANRFC